MSSLLKTQLKKVRQAEGRINPDATWMARTREQVIAHARASAERVESSITSSTPSLHGVFQRARAIFPSHAFAHARPLMMSLVVFVLASGGWIASASASESLPGDALWHVKLASEKTQIVLADITGNEQKNVELQLKFAHRRAEEITVVSKEETFDAEEKTKRTEEGLKQLKETISSVDIAIKSEEQKKGISKNAKEVSGAVDQISTVLKDVVVADAASDVAKEVVAVKQVVDDVSLTVVQIAVEGAENDAERIAAQELVEEKIVSIISDADGAISETAKAKALVEQVDVTTMEMSGILSEVSSASATTSMTSPSSSDSVVTTSLSSTTSTGASTTTDATTAPVLTPKESIAAILAEITTRSEVFQAQIEEIKALVLAGDLTGALEQAKLLKRATTESTQKALELTKTVEQVTLEQQSQSAIASTSTDLIVTSSTPKSTTSTQ